MRGLVQTSSQPLSSQSEVLWPGCGWEMAFRLIDKMCSQFSGVLKNESTKDAEAAKVMSLKNPCLKILFLTIFQQGKDKHKHISDLENCLSSVKVTDFSCYEFHSLKVSHKMFTFLVLVIILLPLFI